MDPLGKLGRFISDASSITNRSLRPEMEGLPARPVNAGVGEVPDIPFERVPERLREGGAIRPPHFGDTLETMLREVNDLQQQARTGTERMLTGEVEDVHQVMIAVEKANTSFLLMMEIRNKLVEAYREVMRMQT